MHACNCSCRLFFVVVRFASVVCSSICFFPDRITKWWCEIRRVLRLFLDNLTRQAIHLYSCLFLCGLLGVLWYLFSVMLMLFLSCVLVTYPIHLLPQSKMYYRHSPPITLCLMFVALRVVGMLRAVVYLDLVSGYVGRLIHDSSMVNVGKVNNDDCHNKNWGGIITNAEAPVRDTFVDH